MNSLLLQLTHVSLSFNSQPILTDVNLTVYQGDRIGIIGANGMGKTTLLNVMAGQLHPDQGHCQAMTDFGYFKQQAPLSNTTPTDGELLSRLQVPQRATATLSGGEAAKLRLAQLLGTYPAGMLLDEPTAQLDARSRQTLLAELRYYYGGMVVVSHDRDFLDQLVTKIWVVAQGQVTVYEGNYSAYRAQLTQADQTQRKAATQYQRQQRQLTNAIELQRQHARQLGKVSQHQRQRSIKPDRYAASKQKDSVQKAAQKKVQTLIKHQQQLKPVAAVTTSRPVQFPVPTVLALHNHFPIMGMDVRLAYGEHELLRAGNFQLPRTAKVALVGDNGVGKTTLLNHIRTNGAGITLSPKVKFAVFKQRGVPPTSQQTVLAYLARQSDYTVTTIRRILNQLHFTQRQCNEPIDQLSGGEMVRLALAEVFVQPANVLVLDEPTNFIDLPTMIALTELIRIYPGMMLFTSHDQRFVTSTATQIYRLEQQQLILVTTEK